MLRRPWTRMFKSPIERLRGLRQPSAATVISFIALSLALGGTATAGVVLTGGGTSASNHGDNAAVAKKQRKGKSNQRTTRVVGPQGAIGPQGSAGADGLPGADGAQGLQGDQGAKGDTGPQGDPGQQGLTGGDGTNGTNGADGTDGTDGTNGTNGTDGTDGASGAVVVGFAGDIQADGTPVEPIVTNGTVTNVARQSAGNYVLTFSSSVATATATLQDSTAAALISTQVQNTQQAGKVLVKVRQLPGLTTGVDAAFAIQVTSAQ